MRSSQALLSEQGGAVCQARPGRGLGPSLGGGLCQHKAGEGGNLAWVLLSAAHSLPLTLRQPVRGL
jgi:hypothetical protein